MSGRQSFNDFLNSSPGPSSFRGRGRGRGRGGGYGHGDSPGGGRGGRSGFGGAAGGGAGRKLGGYNADYKSVGFDYSQIANQKYVNMASYNVNPYGANSDDKQAAQRPSSQSPFTPRGRGGGDHTARAGAGRRAGIGRGGFRADSSSSFSAAGGGGNRATPSGSRTPVTGLGFKGKGKAREDPIRSSHAPGRTLRSGEVIWGGGAAPLFVKAGELFKDGEVDDPSVSKDVGVDLDVTAFRPAGDTDDDDGVQDEALTSQQAISLQSLSIADATGPEQEVELPIRTESQVVETVIIEEEVIVTSLEPSTAASASSAPPPVVLDKNPQALQPEPVRTVPSMEAIPDEILFFVDTAPASGGADPQATLYDKASDVAIGTSGPRSDSEEEQIVYAPRTYRQPEAISLPTAVAAGPSKSAPVNDETIRQVGSDLPSRVFIDPRARMTSRKAKKAAKKEKRRNRGKRGRKSGGGNSMLFSEDSDLEWGSDGPPPEILAVHGAEAGSDARERDVEVLKDYLAGTKLGKAADEEEQDESDIDNGIDEDDEVDLEAMRRFGIGAARLASEDHDVDMSDESSDGSSDSAEEVRPAGRRKTANRQGGVADAQTDDDAGPISQAEDLDDDVELDSEAEGSDSDESSSLGAIQAVMGDLDDFDTEDEEALLFTGQDGWAKETHWFIKNMEDALDGGAMSRDRASRNKLFKSIENGRFGARGIEDDGDFSDDWNIEPVKKSKKNKHIPAALQAQWEKDRQKKALKREQRELERLIAQLNPSLASMGKGGKKGKGGKGKSKAQQAAMAHLIPASAAEVADMFDIPTDEDDDDGPSLAAMRMGKMRGLLLPKTLPQVEIEIRQFLLEDGRTTHSLPPMDKEARAKVHMLAEAFDLKSKSKGKGSERFTILIKTSRSGRNNDERKIARLVAASAYTGGQFYKAMYAKGGKSGSKSAGGGGKGAGDRGSSTRAREGDLVGEGAAQIGQENIGHKLLSKMGWAAGDRIGRTGGLEAPIVAVVKYTKRGLGV